MSIITITTNSITVTFTLLMSLINITIKIVTGLISKP